MAYENLLLEKTEAGVAVLTVNRPKSLNALNTAVLKELDQALSELAADAAVRAVVLTGSGEKAFVAGADISEMAEMSPAAAREFSRLGSGVFRSIEELRKPVIAAVNGYALGGGLELALACDFIYASDNARLGLPETTLGVIPGFGGTRRLAARCGAARAREMIFTGRPLDAAKAAACGLVNEVFPQAELLKAASAAAGKIAANGPLAVAAAKDAVDNGAGNPEYEPALFSLLFATADQREGMKAFTEKRKADFKGE